MQLTSSAFQTNTPLPIAYTCKGRGVNPPLRIENVPDTAKSLALIMHDPDAVGGRDFLHWLLWNIRPDTTSISEGDTPDGAIQGTNDYPSTAYGPACPPAGTGTHGYIFDLYALDTLLDLPSDTDRKTLEQAIANHTLATARLVGTATA